MKTFKKGILALGLTLGIIASVGGAAFASSGVSGNINGTYTIGASSISYDEAKGRTMFGTLGLVTVSSDYTYINVHTLSTGTQSKYDGDTNRTSAVVSFVPPRNCRSVMIKSTHYVYAFGRLWSAKTDNTY